MNAIIINNIGIGLQRAIPCGVARDGRTQMQTLMTAVTVMAGMALSLTIAILVEELIFGKVFGLFFARPRVQVKSGQKR
jgi:hypothetical protein